MSATRYLEGYTQLNLFLPNALYLHLKRANKVTHVCKTALGQHQSPLNPEKIWLAKR